MDFILRRLRRRPKRVLLSRTDRIGDFILTLPVLEAMKRHIGIDFAVLCRESVAPLLEGNPHCGRAIPIRQGDSPQRTLRAIREGQFDCLLVLVNDPTIRKLLPELRHIPNRIGPLSKLQTLLHYTHPILQKRSKSIKNEAEYNMDMLRLFDRKTDWKIRPKLYLNEAEIKETRCRFSAPFRSPKPKIVLHAGMGGSALNWPEFRYQKLIERLVELDNVVILTGAGREERKANERFIGSLNGRFKDRAFNLAEQVNLRQLAALISQSDLFIGPSTGPTHIANAVGTPIVAFYPPVTVQSSVRWGPYLADAALFVPDVPCGRKYRCAGEACGFYCCMERISVETVLQKVMEIIGKKRAGRDALPPF